MNASGELRCKNARSERQPFFGDLHVHTALSLDANLQGTRLRPAEAYRFARGEEVGLPPYDAEGNPSRTLKLSRPLDFVALSDHAEFLGLTTTCLSPGLEGYDSETCVQYRDSPDSAFVTINAALGATQGQASHVAPCSPQNAFCSRAAHSAWDEVIRAAQKAHDETDECAFTAFVAYEWSASPDTRNLHRNVIFRSEAVPDLPFSYFDGNEEEDLWDHLEKACLKGSRGCDVLTIPHNSNLSAGLMFEGVDKRGRPFGAEYAKRRRKFEPLVEIFQHKGSSECLPGMGPDELCNFELMPYNTLASVTIGGTPDELTARDYVRDALLRGLSYQTKLNENPFAYGFVASTDTHFGTPGAVSEATFAGHGGAGSNARAEFPAGLVDKVWLNPGGLTVLWAEQNTRDSLFSAMKRREAYATSGPRITLRLFAGPDLPTGACEASDFAAKGYASGVPMGGELTRLEKGPLKIAVSALKDPGTQDEPGVMLERIQVVKGSLERGAPKITIFEVAGNPGASQVNPQTCEPDENGASELCGVLVDDAFDPNVPAFYYARVLEVPTCRWQARICARAQVDCANPQTIGAGLEGCCLGYPKIVQERAWSSPVFYTPE